MNKFINSNKLKHHPENVAEFLSTGFASPISAQFQITNRCPFRCIYCDKRLDNEESVVDDKFINRLRELGVKSIVLTGGEPTIYTKFETDIPKLAAHFDLGLVTTLINYQPLLETHFTWVKVSMDAVDEEMFVKIKRNRGITKILENLERLYKARENRMPLGTQIVLVKENKARSQILKFIETVENICDYIQIRPIESVEKYEYDQSDYDFLEMISKQYKKVTISDKFFLNHKPTACPARWSQLLIDGDHNLNLCCNRALEKIGSIYDEDILEKSKAYTFDFSGCYHSCVMTGNNEYLKGVVYGAHKNFV